ncbi:hypothetical protein SAMN05880558_1158 [Aeromonas sp. RU39B]|jgi:hypothetical protein|nr:hypothetical protein SAMN05880558_1158 [Aeromonas sp. RU39B]
MQERVMHLIALKRKSTKALKKSGPVFVCA